MSVFDFDQVEQHFNRSTILDLYSEDQLYTFYCPEFHLGDILSPFGGNSRPSFGFYEGKDNSGRIYWKDSKSGDKGDVFKFIEKIYQQRGISFPSKMELYKRIHEDMSGKLILETTAPIRRGRGVRSPAKRKQVSIEIVKTLEGTIPNAFMPFWYQWGITGSHLDAYHVGFADEVWLYRTIDGEESQMLWGRSTIDNPIFYYLFPNSGHVKCYRPYEKKGGRKWLMNCNNTTDVQGLAQCQIQLRRPRLLVITKSMKDVIFLRTLGIDAIAFHGEGNRGSITADFIAYLKQYCGFIISLMDNDFPGIRGAIWLRDTYDIPLYFYPKCYGVKDSTDAYLAYQSRFFILVELLDNILKHDYPNRYTGIGPSVISRLHAA